MPDSGVGIPSKNNYY